MAGGLMRLSSGWLSLMLLVFCCGTMVAGQRSPMDAAADLAGKGLNGDWKSVNPSTRGLTRIAVDGSVVHPYGACHPTPCDWGELHAQSFASKPDAQDSVALLANYDTNFGKSVLTISLESDGRLRVQVFMHYTDASRRGDAAFVEYFSRA
jgi:hypothetical protein